MYCALSLGSLLAAPYGEDGRAIAYKQPGGKTIQLKVLGDEFYARTITPEGYTVVYNPATQAYHYARIDSNGNELVATSLVVGVDRPVGLRKGIELSGEKRQQKWEARQQKFDADLNRRWIERVKAAQKRRQLVRERGEQAAEGVDGNMSDSGSEELSYKGSLQAATVSGVKKGLTILVQFPEDVENGQSAVSFPAGVNQAKMERFCNEVGYNDDSNAGSVKDYFWDQSGGLLDYTMKVTHVVTLPKSRNWYNFSDFPTNTVLRDAGTAGNILVDDAVNVLIAEGYNFDGLSTENGRVVSTNLFFAGSTSGVWSEGLWPHRWRLGYANRPSVTVNGSSYEIYNYQITNINSSSPSIGTFIHESGHLITSFPDLYDTDSGNGSSRGLGRHCLMASGNYAGGGRTPAPVNLYLKDTVGWATITDIQADEFHAVTFNSRGNVGYRIYKPGSTSEYFLFDNRAYDGGSGDKWAASVPDKGLLVWHIDESVNGNRNQQMTASLHYEVSLEQQDGLFELENNNDSGDSGDAYDQASKEFNDSNTPNANWWDGTASGIVMNALSSADGSTMEVEFGQLLDATVLTPNGGEVIALDGPAYLITWEGSFTGNVSLDLYQGGAWVETLAVLPGMDKSYSWYVNTTAYAQGSDYTIKITDQDMPGDTDQSDASFSLLRERFPVGGLVPAGWGQALGSDAGWVLANSPVFEGSYSLESGDLGSGDLANKQAGVEFTGDFAHGIISFQAKVSSEAGDRLVFYIDDVEQVLSSADFSGEIDWVLQTLPVSAGVHTLRWSYQKDDSLDGGADKAWIDDVSLPLTEPSFTREGRDSSAFANSFSYHQIWDDPGSVYINGWSGSTSQASLVAEGLNLYSPGSGSSMLNGTNASMDGGVSDWTTGNDGDWTVEARIRFNECSNGYSLWLGTGTDRIVVEIYESYTKDKNNSSYNVSHSSNEDGQFHIYRVAHDSVNRVYHLFRDGVRVTPLAGAPYDLPDDDERLLFGDYTSGGFGNGYDVTIDYICYDQSGDYLPLDADLDGDGMADYWEYWHFSNFTIGKKLQDPDGDGISNWDEYILDSEPNVANSGLVARISTDVQSGFKVSVDDTSVQRYYTLYESSHPGSSAEWLEVNGAVGVMGNGGALDFEVPEPALRKFYKAEVKTSR